MRISIIHALWLNLLVPLWWRLINIEHSLWVDSCYHSFASLLGRSRANDHQVHAAVSQDDLVYVVLQVGSLRLRRHKATNTLRQCKHSVDTTAKARDPFSLLCLPQVLTRGCRGPYFSMALLNGVGVRGIVHSSDLWLGVTNLRESKVGTQMHRFKSAHFEFWTSCF